MTIDTEDKFYSIWIVEDNNSLTFFETGKKLDMIKRASYFSSLVKHIITDENGDVMDINGYKK